MTLDDHLRRDPQDGFGVRCRNQHMPVFRGRHERNGRNSDDDFGAIVDRAQLLQQRRHVVHHFERILIAKAVDYRIEVSSGGSGADGKHRAVDRGIPDFGEAQSEDQHVHRFEGPADGGEMLEPVLAVFIFGRETFRLDLGAIGVEQRAAMVHPNVLHRRERSVSSAEQLQKLSRAVDIAISRCEPAVVKGLCSLMPQEGMRGLGYQEAESQDGEPRRNVLREAASGRHFLVRRRDLKGEIHDRISGRSRARNGASPQAIGLGGGIRVAHSNCLI